MLAIVGKALLISCNLSIGLEPKSLPLEKFMLRLFTNS
jgi:hypothetical protein